MKKIKYIVAVIVILWAIAASIYSFCITKNYNKKESEYISCTIEYNKLERKYLTEVEDFEATIKEKDKEIKKLKDENAKLKKNKTKKVKKTTTSKKNSGNKAIYQQYAHDLVINKYHWSENDFNALVKLWNKESGWKVTAKNKSGAYGIPQAKPASKMAKYGKDYLTNYKLQIQWGLEYVKSKYGSPSAAWEFFQKKHWY